MVKSEKNVHNMNRDMYSIPWFEEDDNPENLHLN